MKNGLKYQEGVLAIGAHPDDIELGCGASLARLVKDGYHVVSVVMTAGTAGCNSFYDRKKESSEALLSLGCKQIFHFHFEDTRTSLHLDKMISSIEGVINDSVPKNVRIVRAYIMHDSDRHQDHRAVHKASIVACRFIPQILAYETPSTALTFIPQVFENVTENYFNRKLHALSYHKSQMGRYYMQHEYQRTVAQFRGQQGGCKLSEGFIVHKMIL